MSGPKAAFHAPRTEETMETNIDKLRLALAGAALSLLAYAKAYRAPDGYAALEMAPFSIAELLGYAGKDDNAAVEAWLKDFFNGPIAGKVAAREK